MEKYERIFIASTDTVVGIGGPMNLETKEILFKLKERPKNKPLLIMVGTIEEARKFKGWNKNAEKLAKKYWPGQVTIIVGEIGIRIPDNILLIKLLKKIGPIYMTSANKSGNPTLDIEKAKQIFPEVKNIYNFGKGSNIASTIVKADNFQIIRQGSIIIHF